jgi:hypothetical protein
MFYLTQIVAMGMHVIVYTLALGSQPRQGHARAWAKSESPGVTSHVPRVWESVKMKTHTPK